MGKWKEYNLNEVYDFASGLSKPRAEFGFGYDFLSFKDVFHNYFIPEELTSLVNSTEREQATCSIKRGDVFLTRTSETQEELGLSSVALKDYPTATFNGFTKRLRPNGNVEILPEYAGFYFRTPKFRTIVTSMASITTRASLNNELMSALKIIVPPLKTQEQIADVLLTLNKKIDLLHRQNKTLEALAETLFRKWFVEDNSSEALGDLTNISTGKGLKRNEFNENAQFRIIGANGEIGRTDKFLLNEKAILTGRVGTLGQIAIIEDKVWISDNVLIIKPREEQYFYPIYFSLKRVDFENLNSGSTQPLITQTDIKQINICISNRLIRDNFLEQCMSYFKKIKLNSSQIQTLTQLRDTLLPKLMSGEVSVSL